MSASGLTVFGPEVAKSGMTEALHRFIRARTGLEVAECFVTLHTRHSIQAFYQLTGSTGGAYWGEVESLFDLRPACVTLWSGDGALARLQKLKGATQPAAAAPGTIRSLFWCDNPIANLVHVSDSEDIMASELHILRSKAIGNDLHAWRGAAEHRFSHSGLWTLNALLARIVGLSPCHSGLPADGDVHISARLLWQHAGDLARRCGLEEAVQRYLAGNEAAIGQLLKPGAPVTAWERMILRCGLYSNPVWSRLIAEKVPEESLVRCR